MECGILGPLTINGQEVSELLTAPKPRSVLAMLMVEPNRAVSTTALIQELWDERPPRSALTTLQTYILQLRRMLGEIGRAEGRLGRDILVTRVPGYLLRADLARHDLRQYEQLVALGQKALAQGAPARASELLTKALGMWRGEPMSDIRHGPLLAPQVRRLEESRLVATELRIEAEMQLGRHHEVLSDLAVLVANNPMHEGFRAQHMLALFRAGRLSAALDSFHQFRHTLVSDLGLEPSARLRDLHHAILAS